MTTEQMPSLHPAENLYDAHKADVKATRELGGLAFAGVSEPGAELSPRAQYLLDRADGDAVVAAAQSKAETVRNDKTSGEIISKNLDQYIPEAREDMVVDKMYQTGSKLLSREALYKMRRDQGIALGEETAQSKATTPLWQMEAQRAIDPRTGEHVNDSPLHQRIN